MSPPPQASTHPLFLEATALEQHALEKFIQCPSRENWEELVKISRQQYKPQQQQQQYTSPQNQDTTATTANNKADAEIVVVPDPVKIKEEQKEEENHKGGDSSAADKGIEIPSNIYDGDPTPLIPTSEEVKVMNAQFTLFEIEIMDDDELYNGLRNIGASE